MIKRLYFACIAAIGLLFTSCSSVVPVQLVPQALSTAKAVAFDELNLTSKEYTILDRIEASARIEATITNSSYTIKDPDGKFELYFTKDQTTGQYKLYSFEGVVRAGYLSSINYYGHVDTNNPEDIVQKLAIYRIIDLIKEQGGDGIIEPVITTNIEQKDSRRNSVSVTYMTTISGKVVKLKTSE